MAEPFVSFPGTTGNYVSTPDVNLLDADDAHCQQSIGGWGNNANMGSLALASTPSPVFGSFVGSGAVTGTPANAQVRTGLNGIPYTAVSSDTEYAAQVSVRSELAGRSAQLILVWRDGAGSFLNQATGTATALSDSEWTTIAVTGTSVSSAALANITVIFTVTGGGNLTAGEECYWDAACLRTGDATFVPSLRIVGDLDIEAKAALDDWTPGSASALIRHWTGGGEGFALYVNTSGTLDLWNGGTSGPQFNASTVATGVADGSTAVVRATKDVSTGTIQFFVDGSQLGADVAGVASALDYGAVPLDVPGGVTFEPTDYYYVTVRDGIDGPIVARFSAADVGTSP